MGRRSLFHRVTAAIGLVALCAPLSHIHVAACIEAARIEISVPTPHDAANHGGAPHLALDSERETVSSLATHSTSRAPAEIQPDDSHHEHSSQDGLAGELCIALRSDDEDESGLLCTGFRIATLEEGQDRSPALHPLNGRPLKGWPANRAPPRARG